MDVVKIGRALCSDTRFHILCMLKDEEIDVSDMAVKLRQTEANTSAQVRILEDAGLIDVRYETGKHGIKKLCKLRQDEVLIKIE